MRLSARPAGVARLTRLAIVAAAVLISMSLLAPAARAGTTITSVMIYDASDTLGGDYVNGGWEAPECCGDGTMVLDGTDYLLGVPLSIDISAPGTYDLSYTTDRYLSFAEYAGLELFFDGSSAPGITVLIDSSSQATLIAPSTTNRLCQGYPPASVCTATTGLDFVDGAETVTATGFTANNSTGPWTGDINLKVTSTVPEPASMGLVPVGFLAMGLAFQARRKRNRNR
ncbi:MAG: hypothetical protein ACLQGV_09830 [Bryobacteraceae bacterium]